MQGSPLRQIIFPQRQNILQQVPAVLGVNIRQITSNNVNYSKSLDRFTTSDKDLQGKDKTDRVKDPDVEKNDEDGVSGEKHAHITQHWQLLGGNNEGGRVINSPSQKQRQALKDRALKANSTVLERRMGQLAVEQEGKEITSERDLVKAHQTRHQMDRLVEDLIQEGMAKGAFDNLAGAGKPLPERPADFNPYIDSTTHKMNQVVKLSYLVLVPSSPDFGRNRVHPSVGGASEGDST